MGAEDASLRSILISAESRGKTSWHSAGAIRIRKRSSSDVPGRSGRKRAVADDFVRRIEQCSGDRHGLIGGASVRAAVNPLALGALRQQGKVVASRDDANILGWAEDWPAVQKVVTVCCVRLSDDARDNSGGGGLRGEG